MASPGAPSLFHPHHPPHRHARRRISPQHHPANSALRATRPQSRTTQRYPGQPSVTCSPPMQCHCLPLIIRRSYCRPFFITSSSVLVGFGCSDRFYYDVVSGTLSLGAGCCEIWVGGRCAFVYSLGLAMCIDRVGAVTLWKTVGTVR